MITRTAAGWQTEDWQIQLSHAVNDVEELLQLVQVPISELDLVIQAHKNFPMRVPRAFIEKMKVGDARDPLLLQALPMGLETQQVAGFVGDPLAEKASNQQPGLLHKYKNRVLLVLSGACGINCRYCFRRHFDYQENRMTGDELESVLAYLQQHEEVNEVIVSGGDPLVISNTRFGQVIQALESISHIKRLRIHTRMPVVIPQRIDLGLLDILANTRLNVVMVVHSNHANELDETFQTAMFKLKQVGVHLLNQSVLLRGINDHAAALIDLSEKLFDMGVQPYYLHLLDPVAGAAHFDVPQEEAVAIMQDVQASLSGYLVPRLVREIPGKPSKTPIPLS